MRKKFLLCIFTLVFFVCFLCGNISASATVNSNVYNGSYNSTVVDMWQGLVNNNVGKDYVAFRSSQYDYYIFFGDDFTYSNGVISGTGVYIRYYTTGNYNSEYVYTTGNDTFSVNTNNWYVYTNVVDSFPSLSNERMLLYEQVQAVAVIGLLLFGVMRWIFSGK